MSETPKPRIVMDVCKDGWTGGLQLGISALGANGTGHGYRIAGPKYNGSQKRLLKQDLTARDAREIREYLDLAFPPETKDSTDRAAAFREVAEALEGRACDADFTHDPRHIAGLREGVEIATRMADTAERGGPDA